MELNVTVLRGPLSSPPELRTLPSGSEVATLSVRVPAEGRSTSVPVTVWDPPAWIGDLVPGEEVLVLGAVRRRFYRTAGGTGSRVDVEASFITRDDRRRRPAFARRVEASLAELA
jgi:single-strand DNA-binding protein